jgi:hypothetical protein
MRFTHMGAASALLAASQAFLLPPTITEAEDDIVNTLHFDDANFIKDHVMEINCPGCPVAIADVTGKIHLSQVENALRLNFSLSRSDNDQLLLNDIQIYPVDPHARGFMEPLTVDQLVKSSADTWEYAASPNLGYSLTIAHPTTSPKDEQLDLVTVKLEVLEVADKFVSGIPIVTLKLLETTSGKLMIGDAEIGPGISKTSVPTGSDEECTTMLCKWRAIIADKVATIKGCAGKSRSGAHGKHGSGVRTHGHGRPHPHGPHHRHHHKHGSFARFLRSVVLHVFIPIMIGVVVGVTTSLVGMIVGHLIVFIWRMLFRRGQYRKVHHEVLTVEVEETKSFLDHQGPPPTYEEAPAYADAVIKKTSE